jgi:hypothetical protein
MTDQGKHFLNGSPLKKHQILARWTAFICSGFCAWAFPPKNWDEARLI